MIKKAQFVRSKSSKKGAKGKKEDDYDKLMNGDDFGLAEYFYYYYKQDFEEPLNKAMEKESENEIKKVRKSMHAFLKDLKENPDEKVEHIRSGMIEPFRAGLQDMGAMKATITTAVTEAHETLNDAEVWLEMLTTAFLAMKYPGVPHDWQDEFEYII